jgi:Protein of unknown function (DUF2793).
MADNTTNLKMPFILPSQAQKHVTHNEALLALDALVHLTIAEERAAPPESPADGRCYAIATGATGAWADRAGKIAAWQDGVWHYLQPKTGWRAWFTEENRLKVYADAGWQEIPLPDRGDFTELGIGATADESNRLAVSSPASLFNHAGQGHQIKVNKAASGDTASLLFQTNWSGRAELGLAGDDAFSIKVSDGSIWQTALHISPAGHVTRPQQPAARLFRSGSSFTPTAGQQSGFTDFAVDQGGVTLGASTAGGGNRVVVPVDGLYLVSLQVGAISSSGHTTTLVVNGTQLILTLIGTSGGAQSQSSTGIFALSAGDFLTLGHAGSATFEAGAGKTELSILLI